MDTKIEKAIEKLLVMYEKIENDLLVKIAGHFSVNDEFLNSDHWRIKKLEEMGLFNQNIIDYLSRETRKTKIEIKKALNQIGIDTINIDKLNKLFEDEVLKVNPKILYNNYTIKNIINTAYDELSNTLIQMSSKIEKGTREAYLSVVEDAYLKTSMGTHSYAESIRTSINDLSNKGIKVLTYKTTDESGNVIGIREYDIEGAVRREVLTASRQLNNAIAMETANELECEYLYLSEHLQCRPSHFDWQGTVIKRENLIKVTHYGEVDGLAGINCRHYFEPYFGDARDNELKHFNKEECTNAYNLSQHQRYLERGIRKWKRKAEMFKANDDLEAYTKCKDKVKEWQSRMKNFTNENDLKRDYNREYTSENNKKTKNYEDLTEQLKNMKCATNTIERRLNYSIDSDGNKHTNFYFEENKKIIEEIKYQKKIEEITGYEVYLNPKTHSDGYKNPDFWIKDTDELWDLKGIDGNSKNVIDNILHNASKKNQTPNLILKQRKTSYEIEHLKRQLKNIFEKNQRKKIKQVILFDKNDNVIVYYKR